MYFGLDVLTAFSPDHDGIAHQISGDELLTIQGKIQQNFMMPVTNDVGDQIEPPLGIPGDFALIIKPLAQQSGRMGSLAAGQEETIYQIYGTTAAKTFLVEECGIEL